MFERIVRIVIFVGGLALAIIGLMLYIVVFDPTVFNIENALPLPKIIFFLFAGAYDIVAGIYLMQLVIRKNR